MSKTSAKGADQKEYGRACLRILISYYLATELETLGVDPVGSEKASRSLEPRENGHFGLFIPPPARSVPQLGRFEVAVERAQVPSPLDGGLSMAASRWRPYQSST